MLESEKDIPKGVKTPRRDYGACMATCQCFSISRKYGETVAQLFGDMWCPEPVIGIGLAETPKFFLEGYNRYPGGVASLEDGVAFMRAGATVVALRRQLVEQLRKLNWPERT